MVIRNDNNESSRETIQQTHESEQNRIPDFSDVNEDTCLDAMVEHLSLVGFLTESKECNGDTYMDHPMFPALVLSESAGGVSFLVLGLPDVSEIDTPWDTDELISGLNKQSVSLRFYRDDDLLVAKTWLTPGYCNHCFSTFAAVLCRDLTMLMDEIC